MQKATILIVEDEPNLLLGIRDILELDGYEVMTAYNGREALKVLEALDGRVPDLIVSDIMMPYLDGLELLKEIRKNKEWVMIPFIFLTAKGSKQDMQQGKMLGVDDYLIKPFDADDLLVAVESRLDRHRAIHEIHTGAISGIKRNILTILNHEFRTPLTLVVAYADMLRTGNVEAMKEDELLLFLREINTGADRLRRLIENFIMLVELETGDAKNTFDWRKQPVDDIRPIVQNAVDKLFDNQKIEHTYTIQIADSLPVVLGDPSYMEIIIGELLDNAVKFSKHNKQIVIQAEAVDGALHVRIIDQGRGISPDQLDSIWETFYQIDRPQYEDQGTGSGLAIVKGLVELHGATAKIDSTFGDGTTVTVIFPPLTQG